MPVIKLRYARAGLGRRWFCLPVLLLRLSSGQVQVAFNASAAQEFRRLVRCTKLKRTEASLFPSDDSRLLFISSFVAKTAEEKKTP